MISGFARAFGRAAPLAMLWLLLQATNPPAARALEPPSYGLKTADDLIPAETAAGAKFYDPHYADLLNEDLAELAAAYKACDPAYDDLAAEFAGNVEGARHRLDYELQTGGAPKSREEALGEILADDEPKMAHDYEALGRVLEALPKSLPRPPCPPAGDRAGYYHIPGTQTALIIGPSIRLGGHVGILDDLAIANGGLGSAQSVTMAGGSLGLSFPSQSLPDFVPDWVAALHVTAFAESGNDSENPGAFGTSPTARTFFQPNGGIQIVPGFLAGTDLHVDADVERLGAKLRLDGMPCGFDAVSTLSVVPFILFGYTHIEQETTMMADWSGINFMIRDGRRVTTDRASLGGGIELGLRISPDAFLFLNGQAQANLDFGTGRGTYFTEQTGVFSDTVTGRVTDTDVTLAASMSVGGALEFDDGAYVALKAAAGLDQWQELDYHQGQQATLGTRDVFGYGAGIELIIPF